MECRHCRGAGEVCDGCQMGDMALMDVYGERLCEECKTEFKQWLDTKEKQEHG